MRAHPILRTGKLVILMLAVILSVSCKKNAEKVVDCFGESLFVHVDHTADSQNARKVNFSVRYSGKLTATYTTIDYGDGQSAQGVTGTVAHTYASPGKYTVKAHVTLNTGTGTCTVSPTKEVTIQ